MEIEIVRMRALSEFDIEQLSRLLVSTVSSGASVSFVAPLDEANVGRFNKMLAEMCAQTQFIVVTHNRKTMEMGSVLYGVTIQEPGVSKLVSVKWE